MDIKEKKHVATINLTSLPGAYHCNNADFGKSFYSEEDEFPLLYSSHQGRNARCILVDRIMRDGEQYKLQTVQTIFIPWELDDRLCYTPDAIIDKENDFIYVYTGNTSPVTDFFIFKFRLPALHEGDVKLSRNDLLSSWVIFNNPLYYKQGGAINNNIIYILEGVPVWQADNILRIIDLSNCTYKTINLSKDYSLNWEPEDVFFYNNRLYIASNQAGFYLVNMEEE